jgi:hypothetical protein
MAPNRTYAEIAASLNRASLRSAFGQAFHQHVAYICRCDGLGKRKPGTQLKSKDDSDDAGSAKVEEELLCD